MRNLLVGVDVGTGSARAGVFDAAGRPLGRAEQAIAMRRPSAIEAEHDSEDIWRAVCRAVRGALAAAAARAEHVAAIGFDATCSLVVRDRQGLPLPVAPGTAANWDTIVWLDHRAIAEAAECSAAGGAPLENMGGTMSPEMQLPKLMWLKRHLPEIWKEAGHFFDLTDFLTWKASGSLARSRSTLTAKWCWDGAWPEDFLCRQGLDDLVDRGRLPQTAVAPGTDLGPLAPAAAAALGLSSEVRVAAGLIDAHAGMLGVIGSGLGCRDRLHCQLCLVAGTSNSVLALSADRRPVKGVWGPYSGAITADTWLLEAGQSASGALLDHIARTHPAGGRADASQHRRIMRRIAELRAQHGPGFAADLHVLPDFHGNRSPLANPRALGVIAGLGLDTDFDGLCRLYWRVAVALALGVRQNLETLAGAGFATDRLLLAGGHARSPLLIALYADATGATLVEPGDRDAMLLGGAILASVAAGLYPGLAEAAAAMQQDGTECRPDPAAKPGYDRDYRIFLEMQRHRQAIIDIG